MKLNLPRDGSAGADYAFAEIDVLDLSDADAIGDPWRFLVSRLALWISRYHGDADFVVSRCVDGVHEHKRLRVDVGRSVAEALEAIERCRWQPAAAPAALAVHEGDEAVVGRPELLLRLDRSRGLRLGYNGACYTRATISRMAGHLARLIGDLDPARTVGDIEILSRREYQQIVRDFNATSREHAGTGVLERLRELARTRARRPALLCEGRALDYGELLERVERLSAELQRRSAVGEVLGAYLPRSESTVVALLATWHAGLVWLPLGIDHPPAQLEHMCRECGVGMLLCLSGQALPEPLRALETVHVDRCDGEGAAIRRDPDGSDACAAILYTSGSTGVPSGVVHSHRALQNRFDWWLEAYPPESGEVFTQRTALTFIPSLWEMVGGILADRPLLVVPDDVVRQPKALLERVERHACTRLALIPSFLRLLLAGAGDVERKLASLRLLVVAGEPIDQELLAQVERRLPRVRVVNDYGSTETNGVLSCDSRGWDRRGAYLPAGAPISNCQAYVLDARGRVVPIGVCGELHIAGLALGGGYVADAARNAERFVDLELELDGEDARPRTVRVYRTRDRARWLADGRIEVLGRCDNVVKIRGIRVELEAVEAALRALPGIAEAAAACREEAGGRQRLAAWIVAAEGSAPPAPAAIREALLARLPDAAVPSVIYRVDALPRTANGKLSRSELPALGDEARRLAVAPARRVPLDADAVRHRVLETLAVALDCELRDLDPRREFRVLGVDSQIAIEYAQRLSEALGREISVTLLYETSTPERLSERLSRGESVERGAVAGGGAGAAIAVVGIACRLPGASDPSAFWDILRSARSEVGEIPPRRWDWRAQGQLSRWGAFVDDVERFDPRFFDISVREARLMSPEQRVMLECSWQALADAGRSEADLNGRPVGVFVGARASDYPELLARAGIEPDATTLMGNDNAILAARIAYHLDLTGPVLTVDTACSSSLVAVHLACEALRRGECEMALAGGVSFVLTPTQYRTNARAGMLSADGRCKTFDAAADGFVQGEGAAVVALKPLARAIADEDRIYSVICAGAMNQDGKTNGITAPSGEAQRRLLRRVYRDAGLSPAAVGLVEAHGTGTKLGDPIEFQALASVFRGASGERSWCALGSVKTNVGHLIAAAGIAGFVKATLALYRRYLPASLNFGRANEHIQLEGSPFHVPVEGRDWAPREGGRHAAVSAFGFSGTNCHMLLREAPPCAPVPEEALEAAPCDAQGNAMLFAFSARTERSLRGVAADLARWLGGDPWERAAPAAREPLPLRRVARTLARRFNDFERRVLIAARERAELIAALEHVARGEAHAAVLFAGERGASVRGAEFEKLAGRLVDEIASGHRRMDGGWLEAIGALFGNGIALDLERLHRGGAAEPIVDLPPYRFDRDRHWVEEPVAADRERRTIALGRGDFADHRVGGEIWLPATAQLDLLARALCAGEAPAALRLRDWRLSAPCRFVDETLALRLELRCPSGPARARFSFADAERRLASGRVEAVPAARALPPRADAEALRRLAQALGDTLEHDAFYRRCAAVGLDYGPAYRRVRRVRHDGQRVVGFVGLPAALAGAVERHRAELLDGALQILSCFAAPGSRLIPARVGRVVLRARVAARLICVARRERAVGGGIVARLVAYDEGGEPLALFEDILLLPAAGAADRAAQRPSRPAKLARSAPQAPRPLAGGASVTPIAEPRLCVWEKRYVPADLATAGREGGTLRVGVFPGAPPALGEGIEAVAASDVDGRAELPAIWVYRPCTGPLERQVAEFAQRVAWLARRRGDARLLVLQADPDAPESPLAAAALSAGRELPGFRARVVALPRGAALSRAECLCEETGWSGYAGAQRLRPFWSPYAIAPASPPSRSPSPVCLVSGGLGGIGRRLGEWLLRERGARVALVGRSAPSAASERWMSSLREAGHELTYLRCDLSRPERCRLLLRQLELRFGSIDRIYHCAGVTRDALVVNKRRADIDAVIAAKASAIDNLDRAVGERELESMVLFSSISAAVGTPGQVDYASANARLDAFARERNARADRHGHTVSINWGLWENGGMRPSPEERRRLLARHGMAALPDAPAFAAMEALAGGALEQAVVAFGDRRRLGEWLNGSSAPVALAATGESA